MRVERELPTDESRDLLAVVSDLCRDDLAPRAAAAEREGRFPREVFATIGSMGLLGLPYPVEDGGGGLPHVVYLQVLEELSRAWLTVGLGVSVHTLACFPLARYGTSAQRERWLAEMLGGSTLGAYCLSEPDSGSDAGALRTRATVGAGTADEPQEYVLDGTKAWITHAGQADFYTVMARTSGGGPRGISCFLVPARAAGVTAAAPERKLGLRASPTAQLHLSGVRVAAERRIGAAGQGFEVALAALDSGRLGIAACAVGLAQAALDATLDYADQRRQFDRRIREFQGVAFLVADMATAVAAARALYLDAARQADAGRPFTRAAAMAKLVASDAAMRVTTDAVQVFGGAGYVEDHPVERYFREAKALQIVEGTNQVQRMVIARHLWSK